MGKMFDNFLLNCVNAKNYCNNERKQNKSHDMDFVKNAVLSMFLYNIFFKQTPKQQNKNKNNNWNY